MKPDKTGFYWIVTTGALIMLLSMIHIAATPAIFRTGYDQLTQSGGRVFIFLYTVAGLAVMFTGLLVITAGFGLQKGHGFCLILGAMCGMFLLILGIGAISTMPTNPFSYITAVLALALLIELITWADFFLKEHPE